jgi:hypothetical protein
MPYKSPYTFDNLPSSKYDRIMVVKDSIGTRIQRWIGNYPQPEENTKYDISSSVSKLASIKNSNFMNDLNITTYIVDVIYGDSHGQKLHERYKFPLTNINILFNKFLKEIIEWIEEPFWNLFEIVPPINMFQILILKQSDTDKHVEHLEKIIASLCEDNLSLNNRIKALEQQYENHSHIPIAEAILKL